MPESNSAAAPQAGSSVKMPTFGRRDSLMRQASLDRVQMEGMRRQSTVRRRRQLEERSTLCRALIKRLNDAGVELLMHRFQMMGHAPPLAAATARLGNASARSVDFEMSHEAALELLSLSIIFNYKRDSRAALLITLQVLNTAEICLLHIETRPDSENSNELELLIDCRGTRMAFLDSLTRLSKSDDSVDSKIERIQLRESNAAGEIDYAILDEGEADGEAVAERKVSKCIWYPKHVSELDMCAHVVVKYEPTEDPKHPGFADAVYIERRAQLNKIANSYRYGQAIPAVEYTAEEHQTWQRAYTELKKLRISHTCAEYRVNVERMEAEGVITPKRIPELAVLSKYIQRRTGFELRPCGGLLSARDFLASLAFRVFQSTLYVRHHSRPNHCPEPDVIHEVLGHCPMFADPFMAQMSQEIGLLSLGATDEQIERLSTVYWFIVEFGLCREAGRLKAIGAGLISAFGELQHACSDVPRHEPFVPETTAMCIYEDSDYQPVYFVAESICDALNRLREYAQKLCPHYASIYAPLTRTVERLPMSELLKRRLDAIQDDQQNLARLTRRVLALDCANGAR